MRRGDQEVYSARFIRFVRMPFHAEAYRAAYLDQSQSSRNELERLRREFETLPPQGHSGWCPGECPSERCGLTQEECARRRHFHSPCMECRRLRDNVKFKNEPVEIGRTWLAEAPMPLVLMLDLERALSVLGEHQSAEKVAEWLSGATCQ